MQSTSQYFEHDDEDFDPYDAPTDDLKISIISEWEDFMNTTNQRRVACAVCSEARAFVDIIVRPCLDVPLWLLKNDRLPVGVFPKGYNRDVFMNAVLDPRGLSDVERAGTMNMCSLCYTSLFTHGMMPKFALANDLYYGYDCLPEDVQDGFDKASPFELVLISRARASRLCFKFTESAGQSAASRKYTKGNVVVMPQDVTTLQSVLPVSAESIADTVCILFVGERLPSRMNIERLAPVLVRKSRIRTLVEFLVENNPHYRPDQSFQGFSQRNLDELFEGASDSNVCVPACVEITLLPGGEGLASAISGYADREVNDVLNVQESEMLMENVGYTLGDFSATSYKEMKMNALSHCLRGAPFVQSRTGSKMIPDFDNPKLLSWLFPHLDPWGIGSFFHNDRIRSLGMREQLGHLLRLYDSPFAKDPDFVFVFYNILQKKAVVRDVLFRVPDGRYVEIVRDLLQVDLGELSSLQRRFQADPRYSPESEQEKHIMRILGNVSSVSRGVPGSSAYKVKLRNEIRGLIVYKGTPALFLTMSPSDIHHPLVRLIGGHDVTLENLMQGEDMDEWGRRLFAARNPVASTVFFHTIVSQFIKTVLRFGSSKRGLFG
ncbi:hypothetical protein BJ138DRAFT_1010612, partial [Hygrophoropsis aurantiaca]